MKLAGDLNQLLGRKKENLLTGHFSFGRVGAAPQEDNLFQYVVDANGSKYNYDQSYFNSSNYRHLENRNLSFEQKDEWELGIRKGILLNRIVFQYTFYQSVSKGIVDQRIITDLITGNVQWDNLQAIRNKGWELSLMWSPFHRDEKSWSVKLQAAKFQSTVKTLSEESRNIGGGCGCGGRPYTPQFIKEGDQLGTIWVWESRYSEADERFEEIDRNGDGRLDANDQVVAGNAFPSWQLGMDHQIAMGKWRIFARFRGAFGHRLVHINRLFYEVRNTINYSNIVSTKHFVNRPNYFNVLSEDYVEKASYLNLDQLTIAYDMSFIFPNGPKYTVYIGGDHLITITGYTGGDPEVRYQDIDYAGDGSVLNQNTFNKSLSSGFDGRYNYPFARSWYFGIQVDF